MLGKIEGRKRRGQQRRRWLEGITDSMDETPGVGDGQGGLACCGPWGRKELDTTELKNFNGIIQYVWLLLISIITMSRTPDKHTNQTQSGNPFGP